MARFVESEESEQAEKVSSLKKKSNDMLIGIKRYERRLVFEGGRGGSARCRVPCRIRGREECVLLRCSDSDLVTLWKAQPERGEGMVTPPDHHRLRSPNSTNPNPNWITTAFALPTQACPRSAGTRRPSSSDTRAS